MEVYIGLGSNIGDRVKNLHKAIRYLSKSPNVTVKKVSSFVETSPVGGPPQAQYLNAVIKIDTKLTAGELLLVLQEIESRLGRLRTIKNGPRTIDLDILLYGDSSIKKPDLQIPHPRMFEREFVMGPLLEIEPDIVYKLDCLKKNIKRD